LYFSLSNTTSKGYSASNEHKIKYIRILFSILLLVWCAGFLFPALTPTFEGKSFLSQLAAYNYSLVCHQSESANIIFGDSHLLVCARCAGIYAGAFITVIILLFGQLKIKLELKPFIIFSAPLFTDAIAVRIGLYPYSKMIALVTGLLCGAVIIVYILETIENSFHHLKNNYDS